MKLNTRINKPISRPLDVVWHYFLEPKNWEKWWGGKLEEVDPTWQKGGKLIWALGGSDTIDSIVPQKEITLSAQWSVTTWKFKDLKGSVLIEIEEEFRGARPRSEAGWQEEWQTTLLKFKQCIESDSAVIEHLPAKKSPWWKFW
jgi:uncharacterized protein YndB with AHSA1/START domain